MGRWRPPQQRGSKYITRKGAETLQAELTHLWKVERPQVTATVHEAAKNGDRSENGDYIYGKRRLAEIDRRVRYLGKRLDELTVVDTIPQQQDKVFFGAYVTLYKDIDEESNKEGKIKKTKQNSKENEEETITYQIVGPDEFNLRENKLSMDSPLARALLGKLIDDEITISTPNGEEHYVIDSIEYKLD